MIPTQIASTYCTHPLHADWTARELLQTFGADLDEVPLLPDSANRVEITHNSATIWDRPADGGYPDAKILKQRARDRLDPERSLGPIDGVSPLEPANDA